MRKQPFGWVVQRYKAISASIQSSIVIFDDFIRKNKKNSSRSVHFPVFTVTLSIVCCHVYRLFGMVFLFISVKSFKTVESSIVSHWCLHWQKKFQVSLAMVEYLSSNVSWGALDVTLRFTPWRTAKQLPQGHKMKLFLMGIYTQLPVMQRFNENNFLGLREETTV